MVGELPAVVCGGGGGERAPPWDDVEADQVLWNAELEGESLDQCGFIEGLVVIVVDDQALVYDRHGVVRRGGWRGRWEIFWPNP